MKGFLPGLLGLLLHDPIDVISETINKGYIDNINVPVNPGSDIRRGASFHVEGRHRRPNTARRGTTPLDGYRCQGFTGTFVLFLFHLLLASF